MLQNALDLAIGVVVKAEHGPSKVRQVTKKICHNTGRRSRTLAAGAAALEGAGAGRAGGREEGAPAF